MVALGTFYGIGVGPGDPDLITVKAASILARCHHVFAPKSDMGRESTALEIASRFIRTDARIYPLTFPMTADQSVLSRCWSEAADQVLSVIKQGADVCFLTLGDCLLYSTYIYLLRELQALCPDLQAVTVPGINSFSAAAALTHFPLGEGKEPVHILPVSDDLDLVRSALKKRATVILMKVGGRLAEIIRILEEEGLVDQAVFVARAGQSGERIVTNLRMLETGAVQTGYLSTILVHAGKRGDA